jgi:hypothetical protein
VARRQRRADPPLKPAIARTQPLGVTIMAKYLVGWLLGVPVVVLVILYMFFH